MPSRLLVGLVLAALWLPVCFGLRAGLRKLPGSGRVCASLKDLSEGDAARAKEVVIELVRTTSSSSTSSPSSRRSARVVGSNAYNLYKDQEEDRMVNALTDSPVLKVVGLLFNPTTLLLVMYFSSIGWSQVLWLQKIFKLFGRGTLSKKQGDKGYVAPVEELPFQVFECEKCKMELRPARGRAEAIFGRERFRCSRCGSKASAYFNVDDLTDPRAVARLERIKKEQEEAASMGTGGEDDDEDGNEAQDDEDDEDDVPPPPKSAPRRPKKF